MGLGRFQCPSASLGLSGQLVRSRRAQAAALAVALAAHLLALRVQAGEEARQAPKPLTTRFVKRQPRLSKPLEMKKRPRPKQRQIRRTMVSVRAKLGTRANPAPSITAQVTGRLARPSVEVGRVTGVAAPELEPETMAALVDGSKESGQRVDTALEMVDIEALDTGQYQAMVIQDPTDKRTIKGFVHLARVYSINTPPEEAGLPYPDPTALGNLIYAVNQYTDIRADISCTYTLDSQELFKTPLVFITCHVQFKLNESERLNLGKYLTQGGFLFADDCQWLPGGMADLSLRTMIKDALASQGLRKGLDYTWETLPKGHPIYHCYFDFEGPPRTPWTFDRRASARVPIPMPEGVTVQDRLVAMYSNWDIGCGWEGPRVYPACADLQHQRLLQLGINMLIFAMTQEGSITHRVLAGVNY